jgi:uncharacterized repeat protein (TIGR01451 family)
VEVRQDWTVLGLDEEDTVAHFDTLDGQTEVEASNRVCIYAPRFASVRQITGSITQATQDRLAAFDQPKALVQQEGRGLATTFNQPLQPQRYLGTNGPQQFREQIRGHGVAAARAVARMSDRLRPHEDFQIIRDGIFDNTEKPRLATRLEAAEAWTGKQAAQVTIDHVTAVVAASDVGLQSVYRCELPPGKPRLRIVKVASTKYAQPGDEVQFTIRFDNLGDQVIGNVTIVDSLTTRLEYVPDTAECSVDATFLTQDNDAESLVLRWEIKEPLEVGEGGIIRFTCRVR